MLYLVNESLFNVVNVEAVNRRTNETIDDATDRQYYPTNQLKLRDDAGEVYPILTQRIFDSNSLAEPSLAVKCRENANGHLSVSLVSSSKNTRDDDVILIGIPYRGILMPVENPKNFFLYKAKMFHSTENSVEFAGQKFGKVLYLAYGINFKGIKEDMENGLLKTDADGKAYAELVIESHSPEYKKNADKEYEATGNEIRYTHSVRIYVEDGYITTDVTSKVVEGTTSEKFSFTDLFKFYKPRKPAQSFNKSNWSTKTKFKK